MNEYLAGCGARSRARPAREPLKSMISTSSITDGHKGLFAKKMEFYYDRKRLLTLKSLISAFDVVDGK